MNTKQIVIGVLALIIAYFFLIPLLPAEYHVQFIAKIIIIILAIFWVLRLGRVDGF